MKRDLKFYLKLFWNTFQLSAFTIGGGYVIVPLMKKQFVEKLGWIEEQEMLSFTAIAQSAPGAIAVNTAVLMGYHLSGIPGALITVFATILPPLILLTVISMGYRAFISNEIVKNILAGMQAGVCAVITDVVIDMSRNVVRAKRIIPVILMTGAFIAVAVFRVNVLYVILVCALAGLLSAMKKPGKEDGHDLS
ncbi:MAG: chromate transporter [Clostridiales bacterium]|nr:chromate transporter [Clostridiales bacterium]